MMAALVAVLVATLERVGMVGVVEGWGWEGAGGLVVVTVAHGRHT